MRTAVLECFSYLSLLAASRWMFPIQKDSFSVGKGRSGGRASNISGSFLTLALRWKQPPPPSCFTLYPKTLWLTHGPNLNLAPRPGEAYTASRFCVCGSSCLLHLSGGAVNKHREINRTAWRHRPHAVAVTLLDTLTCFYDIRQMLPKTSKCNRANRMPSFIWGCLQVTAMLITLPI